MPEGMGSLARDESYELFLQQAVLPARETPHEQGLKGFHELRATYSCERYEQLTGHSAPVNGGHCYRMDRDLDRQARQQISLELGHNRIDAVAAYIGGREKLSPLIWRSESPQISNAWHDSIQS